MTTNRTKRAPARRAVTLRLMSPEREGIKTMDGYKFFAVMPDERKSKSASKQYPMQPWTRKTLRDYAAAGRYVECLAVSDESHAHSGEIWHDCAGALQAGNDQAVCGSSTSRNYLRKRCVRISESLARRLHPALFRYLKQPIGGAR